MKCRAQIIKNRLGPPLRHADFNLYFDSGIDDKGSWLQVLKDHKLLKIAGAWYTLEYKGKDIKFQSKDFEKKCPEKMSGTNVRFRYLRRSTKKTTKT